MTIMQKEAKKLRTRLEESIISGGMYKDPLSELVLLSATLDTIEQENRITNKRMLRSLIFALVSIIMGVISLMI